MLDKKKAAERIRGRLENRLAKFFGCDAKELPALRLGELVNVAFLLFGDSAELGGFAATMYAAEQILGRDILWVLPGDEEEEEDEPPAAKLPKVAVN